MEEAILEFIQDEYLDEDDDDDIELTVDTPLISSGIVDSFSMVSLKRFLETQYDISIPDDQATAEAFDTVKSIVTVVKRFKA